MLKSLLAHHPRVLSQVDPGDLLRIMKELKGEEPGLIQEVRSG